MATDLITGPQLGRTYMKALLLPGLPGRLRLFLAGDGWGGGSWP